MRSPAPAYVNVVMREDVCECAPHVSHRFAFLFLPDSPTVRASKIQIVRSRIRVCWCGAVALKLCRMQGKTARKVRCRFSHMHIVREPPNSEACCIGKNVWKGVQIDFTLWSRMRYVDRCLLRLSAMASSIKWDSAKQGLCMFCWPCNQQGHVFDGAFRVMWMGTAQKMRGRRAWQNLAWQWVADQWRCGRAPWFAGNGTWVLWIICGIMCEIKIEWLVQLLASVFWLWLPSHDTNLVEHVHCRFFSPCTSWCTGQR